MPKRKKAVSTSAPSAHPDAHGGIAAHQLPAVLPMHSMFQTGTGASEALEQSAETLFD